MKHRGPSASLRPAVAAARAAARATTPRAAPAAGPAGSVTVGDWVLRMASDGALVVEHRPSGVLHVLATPTEGE